MRFINSFREHLGSREALESFFGPEIHSEADKNLVKLLEVEYRIVEPNRELLDKKSVFDNNRASEVYRDLKEELEEIEYFQEAVERYFPGLEDLNEDVRKLVFQQVMANADEDLEIDLTGWEPANFGIGLSHPGRTIKIKGDMGFGFYYTAEDGKVILEGDAGNEVGYGNKGAFIHIMEDAGEGIGGEMADGVVKVDGSIGSGAKNAEGGLLEVSGDVRGDVAEYLRGGTVYIRGDVGGTVAAGAYDGGVYIEGDAEQIGFREEKVNRVRKQAQEYIESDQFEDREDSFKENMAQSRVEEYLTTGVEIWVEGEIGTLNRESFEGGAVYQKQDGEWVQLVGDEG